MKTLALWAVRIAGTFCLAHILFMLFNPERMDPLMWVVDLVMISAFYSKEKEHQAERKKLHIK
ncbi:hypothetical protein [Serratia fonticola]|uniref:hypothetical protein n=1 Tax=Serratia fonticola TaxID=47917 RepID=UPI003AAE4CF3